MAPDRIRSWFETLYDAGELVVAGGHADASPHQPLRWIWAAAEVEAILAYEHWRETGGRLAYAVYLAAAQRADAAQDALAAAACRGQGSN
jgi:hypothetical protein